MELSWRRAPSLAVTLRSLFHLEHFFNYKMSEVRVGETCNFAAICSRARLAIRLKSRDLLLNWAKLILKVYYVATVAGKNASATNCQVKRWPFCSILQRN